MRIHTQKLPIYVSAFEDARFMMWGHGGPWKSNVLAFVGAYRGGRRWVMCPRS